MSVVRRGRGAARLVASLLLAGCLAAGCVEPSFTASDYGKKAANTAKSADSVVQTARLTLRLASGRRATNQYLDVLLTDSESTLGDLQTSFGGVQPPDHRSDQLRDQVNQLLGDAEDTLATLRIEVRRGHLDALAAQDKALTDLHTKFQRVAEEHR